MKQQHHSAAVEQSSEAGENQRQIQLLCEQNCIDDRKSHARMDPDNLEV